MFYYDFNNFKDKDDFYDYIELSGFRFGIRFLENYNKWFFLSWLNAWKKDDFLETLFEHKNQVDGKIVYGLAEGFLSSHSSFI